MGTIWRSIFAPDLTCSASSAYFSRIEKGPKNHSFPEPSQIAKVGPNAAFIQGLILFFAPTYVDSVPKMTISGSPSKSFFFQKRALGGTRVGQKAYKKLVDRVARALWGAPWPRPGFAFRLGLKRINKNEIFWEPLWAPAGRHTSRLLAGTQF